MKIIGEKKPIVGVTEMYSVVNFNGVLFTSNMNKVTYAWYIFKKYKNGAFVNVTKNNIPKTGQSVPYSFGYNVEYRLDIYKLEKELLSQKDKASFAASYFVNPTKKGSKSEIKKVVLYNKGAKNVDLAGIGNSLTVRVECINMVNKQVKVHVWNAEDKSEPNLMNSRLIDINEKGIGLTQFNVMQLLSPSESMNLMIGNIKAIGFFVTATYEELSLTNKAAVVVVSQFQSIADIFENARSMSSYNDIETPAPEKPKEKKCFCNRDFKESDVKEFIKFLKGREAIWEGYKDAPCNIDDKSFATLTKELNAMFKKYKINHCAQKLHFLAQACHETDTFTLSEETFGSEASSQSIYKGRGILQLTGVRKNGEKYYDLPGPYETYSDYIGINAIRKPQIISEQIKYCLDSGGWMFSVFKKMPSDPNAPLFNERWKGHKENTIGKSLNELALFGDKYLELISALLNGRNAKTDMPNGWEKRKMNYDLLKTGFFNYDFFHNKKQEIEKNKSNDKWRNPIDNPMLCLYSQGGGEKPWHGSFGEKIRDNSVNHSGCDLFALPETPVYACIKGKIDRVYTSTTLAGNTVVIKITDKETFNSLKRSYTPLYKNKGEILEKGFDLNKSIYLVFMHLSKFGKFKTGDIVEYSDIIGYSGISGKNGKNFTTRNPHLHFEINNVGSIGGLDGKCNPMLYFKFKTENELSETEKNNQLTAKNKEWS
ncbi:hypothetical protein [Empedobacter tilapiae]